MSPLTDHGDEQGSSLAVSRITISTNPAAVNAQRRLAESTKALGKSYEQLASGLRINRASDDAAGLAIASSLNTDSRVFDQGIRNFNDGISLLNIAEGALQEASSIIIRLRELATQSANGTLANSQRVAINEEAGALVDEYNRIIGTTKFNNLNLIDRSLSNLVLQGGYGTNGQIGFAIGEDLARNVAAGTFSGGFSFAYADYDIIDYADINGDNIIDRIFLTNAAGTVSTQIGASDGTFSAATSFVVGTSPATIEIFDTNGDSALDIIVGNAGTGEMKTFLGNGDGSFRAGVTVATGFAAGNEIGFGDLNGDGVMDLHLRKFSPSGTTFFYLGNGNGTFRVGISVDIAGQNTGSDDLLIEDFDNDGYGDILARDGDTSILTFHRGLGNGTFASGVTAITGIGILGDGVNNVDTGIKVQTYADFDRDGNLDLATANGTGESAHIYFGNGDGSFRLGQTIGSLPGGISYPTVTDFNGDGYDDVLIAYDDLSQSYSNVLLGNGDGTFRASSVTVALGTAGTANISLALDANGDNAVDILSVSLADYIGMFQYSNSQEVTTLQHVNLQSRKGALQAMETLDTALNRVNAELGAIGSVQSRLSVALNNLSQASENIQASRSRIVDADIADVSAALVRDRILQQAGAAVLGQANQLPALALTLLGQ